MKLLLASLATGIFVTVGVFFTVLFVRALFKDDASVMFLLWVFWWPIWFLRCVPGISVNALTWVSLAIGMVLDTLFISLGIYCLLRAIVSRRKRAPSTLPPQAPTF